MSPWRCLWWQWRSPGEVLSSRMRLGEEVTEDDVAEAVRLMTAATLTAATNPETGEIDMDLITTGRSATDRERVEQISQVRLVNRVLLSK